jgi:hypothetical protein
MKTELRYGLIFTTAAFAWIILEFLVGLHTTHKDLHPYLSNIFAIPAIWLMVLAALAKRHELGGKITIQQAFMCGLWVSVIVAVGSPLYLWLFFTLINPHFFSDFQQYAVAEKMMTAAEAAKYFSYANYALQAAIGSLGMGAVTSIIVAFFVQKK